MLVMLNTTFDSLKKNYKLEIKNCYNKINLAAKELDFFLIHKEQKLPAAYFAFPKKSY